MSESRPAYSRLFTIDEANAALPLVRAIASDLAKLSREVIERRERLAHLISGRDKDSPDVYTQELTEMEDELEHDARQLNEYVQELVELGVEPKNGPEGLVDFPCDMDGRTVYLCWKLGEPEVLFWHELDAGFAGRQSLTADSVAGHDDVLGHDGCRHD